jgi:CRISPR/Cas system Type II protein with McrA/HNH and RuvC-like nuclease domain
MIVNLKRRYSEYLGFKLKAVPKGKKQNGEVKYTVESHMSDKAVRKVKTRAKQFAKGIEHTSDANKEFKAINSYNAYISGVHNYYRFATHISKDFRKIALGITRTLQNRLKDRLKAQGNKPPPYIGERYGKSKQLRFVGGNPIIPIGYVQTKAPLYKKREINEYTPEGRMAIHKQLEAVDMSILHYLMRNPLRYASIELNVNRLSLYCAQHGKCAVTKKPMEFNEIHCHHKTPRKKGGTDRYANLVLVSEDVHMLIHAANEDTIRRYLASLKLDRDQVRKLNTLRKKAGVPEILK